MKERIMLDPAKIEAHSGKLMSTKPDHRSTTAHLIISSGLPSAIIEGVKHATADEAADLADLLGCDLSDIVAGPSTENVSSPTAPTSPAVPTAPAASTRVCSRKGCKEEALPGKKICDTHYATVTAWRDKKETPDEAAEVAESDELLEQIGIHPEALELSDEVPEAAPTVEYAEVGKVPDYIAEAVSRATNQALAARSEQQAIEAAELSREVRLMLELHKTLVGILISELVAIGSDKIDIRRVSVRLESLAEELAGAR